ncbi:nitrite and sulphite reductase 4Fe-4S region [Desulfofarcimen acetoxidans DSM 771]|uniref:Nitrite and sulphite reductase 4Fe-4S region n=1 Tax=Desulfofarcimen acetoxidans (strain ATCC 49208 / DSM 771 / KCTC 5769 / VKM B-1644 / 5575) TaxID=485916 RepID=C8W6F9_DESAS|nr:NAD(P)/FAD-dependent oxidoreductase [Desulfofarcimen acetoxidans]ACV62248.1 nitrite and sulphite reductase 4Fe-4S region [Desulfofarcimen acetoxidans DSM 771]
MSDKPRGAILQRDGQTYAIVPKIKGGLLDLATLKKLTATVEKYNIPIVKLTSAQRLALVGMKAEDIEAIWTDLGMEPAPATGSVVRSVQVCPGNAVCKNGQQNSLQLGIKIDEMFSGKALPGKVKIGVSGCPLSCAEPKVRDIGLLGKAAGWTLVAGGSAGARPRIADQITEGLTDEQALELISKIIEVYGEQAKKGERIGNLIERIGLDEFKKLLL